MSDLIRNGISVAAMLIVGLLVGFRPDDTWWAHYTVTAKNSDETDTPA